MDTRWLVLLMATTLFAGCTEAGADEPDADVATDGSVDAPEWAIGDAWTFSNMDAEGNTSTVSIIVTGESGGDWIVDTNEPRHAYYDALTDISYLGQVRKSDLAGSQGSSRVQFFDFPLEANKTWRTTWDGVDVGLEVVQVHPDGRVQIQAYDGDRLFADYEYSSEKRFFEYLDFYDENGTLAYEMDLSSHDRDVTGTVYRYELLEPITYSASDAGVQAHAQDWAEGVNEVRFHTLIDCGDAAAGRVGSVVSSREAEEPFVTQLVASSRPIVHTVSGDCAPDVVHEGEDVVDVDPELQYDVELGISAQGATITVTVEPRILTAISV